MRRCVFVGPSLHGVPGRTPDIEYRPPAAQGDLIEAAESGVRWIGLIDGYFGSCASVWHKEILYALSVGCHVWGAASMGALRAAECANFGMRPVGTIASRFASGELNDDADVAVMHGPAEVDYMPFTEALVDARATIAAMSEARSISPDEASRLLDAASSLHFGDRTVDALASGVSDDTENRARIEKLYETHRVRAKQRDALLLVSEMAGTAPVTVAERGWHLVQSASLEALLAEVPAGSS